MDVRLLKYALKANASRNVYIGSGEKARHLARSPLAMPYELRQVNWKDDAERDEKIAAYKVHLWKIMKNPNNPRHAAVWSELRRLRDDSILLCYCYPRNCHGHVIIAAWNWAVAQGKIDAPRPEPTMQQTSTNAEDLQTLETQARANLTKDDKKGKALLPEHTAPGPLDMMSIMDRLGASLGADLVDKKLDEEILAEHVSVCPDCDAPKQVRTRRPRLSFDDPRSLVFNRADEMLLDLADLPALTPAA